jgi:sucrose-phosphate synthase
VATGRTIDSAREVLAEYGVPTPDIFVTSVGAEIYMGNDLEPDRGWSAHIAHAWGRDAIQEAMVGIKGTELQEEDTQRPFKLSYYFDPELADIDTITARLRARKLRFNAIVSHDMFLDFLPQRASKGRAVRYLAFKWDIPHQSIVVCGDSGNDREMLTGRLLGVVVANHTPDLEPLRSRARRDIYFSDQEFAAGIMDGLRHYDFIEESDIAAAQLAAAVADD